MRFRPSPALPLLLFLFIPACDKKPSDPDSYLDESERLLSDEELLTAEDPNAPYVKQIYIDWITHNHDPIRSLTSHNFEDLKFLKPLMNGKRIVQLGESGHGVRQFNMAKVRLIKFFHEELDFDVIAFESSLFECFISNEHVPEFNATELVRHSIFGVWHTYEVLELFDYIKESRSSGDPLLLAGFDIQISSWMGKQYRPGFLRTVLEQVDPQYAAEVYDFDSAFLEASDSGYDKFLEYADTYRDSLAAGYGDIIEFIDSHSPALNVAFSDRPLYPLMARQTAWSMTQFIEQLVASYNDNSRDVTLTRDRGMAYNIDFLLQEAYPGEKILVWAHNFHIRNHNERTSYNIPTMGTWVHQGHSHQLYTVGLYMYRGTAALNNRDTYNIRECESGSLESIFYRIRKKFSFVDLSMNFKRPGTMWMFEELTAKTWGTGDIRMVLKDQYDGILFIDTVEPPEYIYGTVQ